MARWDLAPAEPFHITPADSDIGLVLAFDAVLSDDQRTGVEFLIADAFGLVDALGLTATDEQIAAGNLLLEGTTLEQIAVPEPGSIAIWSMFALAAAGYCWRRRRQSRN